MKNYTITVNGTVYAVTVEEGPSTGAAPAAAYHYTGKGDNKSIL